MKSKKGKNKNVPPDLDSTAKRISNHALFFTTFFCQDFVGVCLALAFAQSL